MTLFTIGSGKKSAREFFSLLQMNNIKRVLDIRLSNTSQLAGYTKKADFEYFLKEIADIDYYHMPELAPTEELLNAYKSKEVSWQEYEIEYIRIITARNPLAKLTITFFDKACLLCSEPTAKQCHRRLLAEYIADSLPDWKIVHL
ncbi:MAG TPA: DUF488 domain-containing protein [Methylomusa anaerophila]|uniref:DUF488 domain-containing protein n=1 Tax=Methylomusa anaerophila TaxID=1930071 RepID=A0A348AN21_9FIRM|nr:DUF488 domain-containing protein [Methylomusa anaerophila]BBB92469.1 hypothetical protein MAMMFC1_03162 [Methylomusa anaerophila]HML87679.1 DUF488 domain-containing protein [Methylomusa anaerophila]